MPYRVIINARRLRSLYGKKRFFNFFAATQDGNNRACEFFRRLSSALQERNT